MTPRKQLRCALYARYSTEKQSEASVDDQFRVCERLAEREGFEVVARFSDAAISGGTANRPGYQSLLEGARRREFTVIVAEDSSRLWRELSEQWRALKELADLRVHVVGHGLDTRREESKMLLAVTGAAAEAYRDEISRRTRRGLEGKAGNGGAGGRAYGYIPAAMSGTGQIEINPAEAAVVVRIFEMYADGHSPRTIAGCLNAEGVPSPGASWNRQSAGPNAKRRAKWVASAIHGDVRRNSGMLNNERYRGRIVWGRMRWERGAADSSKRVATMVEDRSQWVTHEEPRLRIVPEALWRRVKAAQADRTLSRTKVRAASTGRPAAALLSGLLTCDECGSRFVAVDARCYGCSSHKNGGMAACTNAVRIKREKAEAVLLAEIEAEILSDEAIELAQRTAQDELRRQQKSSSKTQAPAHSAKLRSLDTQAQELRALMTAGTLSPHIGQAGLDALERERAELLAKDGRRGQRVGADVVRLIPQTAALYREAVRNLSDVTEGAERLQARALISEMLGGEVKVRPGGDAEIQLDAGVLLACGNPSGINRLERGSGGRI